MVYDSLVMHPEFTISQIQRMNNYRMFFVHYFIEMNNIINKNMYSEVRHKLLLWAFAISILIMILAGPLYRYWSLLPITIFIWWLCDVMFTTRNGFMFEPNYNYWKEANDVEYWERTDNTIILNNQFIINSR